MNPAPPETSPVTSFLTITPEAEKAKNLMKSITLIAEASRTEMQRLILSGATEKIDSEELDSDVRFNLSRTLQEYQELSHLINHHPTANREEIREAIGYIMRKLGRVMPKKPDIGINIHLQPKIEIAKKIREVYHYIKIHGVEIAGFERKPEHILYIENLLREMQIFGEAIMRGNNNSTYAEDRVTKDEFTVVQLYLRLFMDGHIKTKAGS